MMFTRPCDKTEPHEAHEYMHHWEKRTKEPLGWFPPGTYMDSTPAEGSDVIYRCRGVDLEPDRDPFTGSFVSCVVCGMSPQVGGTGFCSRECEADFKEMYPE